MKLPFFNTNSTSKLSEIGKNNLNTDIYDRLRQELQSTPDLITIDYIFTTTHGRSGDRLATKLAKNGDNVHYFLDKDKKYHIVGGIKQSKPKEHELMEMLTAKIEMAVKYNCTLIECTIAANDTRHK